MTKRICAVHCPGPGGWGAGTAAGAAVLFFAAAAVVYGAARIVPDVAGVLLGLTALAAGVAGAGLLAAVPVLLLVRRSSRLALATQSTVAVVTRQNLAIARKRAARAIGPVRVTAVVVTGAPEPARVQAEVVRAPYQIEAPPRAIGAARPTLDGVVLGAGERRPVVTATVLSDHAERKQPC
jgi:hypothetical protein